MGQFLDHLLFLGEVLPIYGSNLTKLQGDSYQTYGSSPSPRTIELADPQPIHPVNLLRFICDFPHLDNLCMWDSGINDIKTQPKGDEDGGERSQT